MRGLAALCGITGVVTLALATEQLTDGKSLVPVEKLLLGAAALGIAIPISLEQRWGVWAMAVVAVGYAGWTGYRLATDSFPGQPQFALLSILLAVFAALYCVRTALLAAQIPQS